MSIDLIIDRLDKVRGSNGRFTARCPAHDDKDPSLSVSEAADGTVLLKCFAGCSADEIVGAIGLDLKDLFPASDFNPEQKKAHARRQNHAEIEEALFHELVVLEQIIATRVAGRKLVKDIEFRQLRPDWRPMPLEHWDREVLAVGRIKAGLGALYGG
jgi:DNA primase